MREQEQTRRISREGRWWVNGLRMALLAGCLMPVHAALEVRERVVVDEAWAGHPVDFALLTDAVRGRQYVGYYNGGRDLVVAERALGASEWRRQVLPTRVDWDSHNSVVLALDPAGHLHVAANMHVVPLIYFRTTRPGDVTSLAQVKSMVDPRREQRVTYPEFYKLEDGTLLFTYRDGGSGNGNQIWNRYDESSARWLPLLDRPLFSAERPPGVPRPAHDPDDRMNAYPVGPVRGPDGFWHLTWVWRDTPMAETNHDLSYVRSRDLVHWENLAGEPVALPITLATPGVTVDPVPAMGGILNGSGQVGFDEHGRVIISYHKFDAAGATQIYLARAEGTEWKIHQLTHWTYRWFPEGPGSIVAEVRSLPVQVDPEWGLWIRLSNAKEKSGAYRLDPDKLELGEPIPPSKEPGRLPPSVLRGVRPGLHLRIRRDLSAAPGSADWLLRWETQEPNRDRPHDGPVPEPCLLEVIGLRPGG